MTPTDQLPIFTTDQVDDTIIESCLFFAVDLTGASYTRTQLAKITREVNKLFAMPAFILFQYGPNLTLAVIDRRLNKTDSSKDVLKKVTLIKDIRFANPHRAHRLTSLTATNSPLPRTPPSKIKPNKFLSSVNM